MFSIVGFGLINFRHYPAHIDRDVMLDFGPIRLCPTPFAARCSRRRFIVAPTPSGFAEIVSDDCPKPLFLAVRDRLAENRKWGIKPHQVEPAGLLSRGIVRND